MQLGNDLLYKRLPAQAGALTRKGLTPHALCGIAADVRGWVYSMQVLLSASLLMWVRCLQFERTLIVAEDDSQVSYLEGCTAPSYDSNQVSTSLSWWPVR